MLRLFSFYLSNLVTLDNFYFGYYYCSFRNAITYGIQMSAGTIPREREEENERER